MSYADFTFYSTAYLGNLIAEADFPRLMVAASQFIDNVTFERAATDTTNTDKIKRAACAVAEELYRQEQAGGADGVVSESQGQYSVSYGNNSSRAKSNQSKLENAARFWLGNTYLMFAGFNSGEYGGVYDDP
jgi:hypothetical protein